MRPATRSPVAVQFAATGAFVTAPSAHRCVRIASRIWSAIPFISAALAVLPRSAYSSAEALAPAYQNDDSVRSSRPCVPVP